MSPLEPDGWAKLLALGLALLLAGLASAAQASLFYINRTRLRSLVESGVPRAEAILKVFDEPTSMFSTILVLGSLGVAGVVGSAVLLALQPGVSWSCRSWPGPWLLPVRRARLCSCSARSRRSGW